jgi:hypothetical protein
LLVIAIFLAFQANNSANLAATSEAGALEAEAEALEAKVTSDFNAELASTREILAVNAQGTSDANALLAVTSQAEAIAAEGVARAEASRAVIAEATAVAAQATSDSHAVQAIDLAQVRLANSNYLATAVARVDDALAAQEAFFAADSNYEAQLIQVQSIRSSLNTVFAQNLQVGLVINPDIDTLTEDVFEGLDWVRLVFKLDAAEQESGDVESAVTRYEPLIEVFALQGISVLFILNQETFWGNAPWEGGDWDTYAAEMAANASNLARAMSNRYARYGALIAYEIWNEPDTSPTNTSSIPIPPDVYAIILEQTAAAIKEASPEASIIFGSLTSAPSNGTAYVQRVQNELGGRLPVDAIGWKPYGRYGTFDPFYNEQFGTLQDWFEIFNDAFPDIPIWVTEIGVPNSDPLPAEYNPLVAAYMLDVYNYIGTNFARQVPVVIWFAWSDWLVNAGIVDKNGNPKDEIYDAFAEVRTGVIFTDP